MSVVRALTFDPLDIAIEHCIEPFRNELSAKGSVVEQSAAIKSGASRVAVHSTFGPATQAKKHNQDAVVLWQPSKGRRIRWAVALADGVSQSYGAGAASRMATFLALGSLNRWDEEGGAPTPMTDCTEYFARLGRSIEKNPERFRPRACYADTWRRALARGQYLQTTLSVLWETATHLYFSVVGDGGFIADCGDQLVSIVPHENSTVDAIGPHKPGSRATIVLALPAADYRSVCAFTDGVSGAAREDLGGTMRLIEKAIEGKTLNPADTVLRRLSATDEGTSGDNMTLALAFRS